MDILNRIRTLATSGNVRVTQHAQIEMAEEDFVLEDVFEAIENGRILENYPDHKRGACCLLGGRNRDERDLHVVCTTENPILIIITVYEPLPPKWVTPTERRPSE